MSKKIITKPFDRYIEPPRQNRFLMPLIWSVSWLLTRGKALKIHRKHMEGLKPPFLVLATHMSFMDFYVTPLALFPYRANYVSELEGFENYGEWLYRQVGCLGTRKFVTDIALVKNIKRVVDRGDILVLYPEARYANVGTSSKLTQSVGKLAKYLNVPLVTINMKGNYLQSPIWNLKKRKTPKLEATVTQLFTAEEIRKTTIEEINEKTEKALYYDEYEWQYEKGFKINSPWRAEGLEHVLYKCQCCNTEFKMRAKGAGLSCESCGASFYMTELGKIEGSNSNALFSHIPHWYEWQREQVIKQIENKKYNLNASVRVESLPNAKNFIKLGKGRLVHNSTGFYLEFQNYENVSTTIHFPAYETSSVHTEYNYRGRGQCIALSTPNNTYFIYSDYIYFNVTKIQFAAEYFYTLASSDKKLNKTETCKG